jgi:hypothetical protein
MVMVIIMRNDSLGVRVLFFIERIIPPIRNFFWAILVEICYFAVPYETELDNHPFVGRILRTLVHGLFLTSIAMLAKAIGLRIFALYIPRLSCPLFIA